MLSSEFLSFNASVSRRNAFRSLIGHKKCFCAHVTHAMHKSFCYHRARERAATKNGRMCEFPSYRACEPLLGTLELATLWTSSHKCVPYNDYGRIKMRFLCVLLSNRSESSNSLYLFQFYIDLRRSHSQTTSTQLFHLRKWYLHSSSDDQIKMEQ